MTHQYNAGDVVTVFQISPSNELVIEGKATIRKRVAEVDEHYRVEFANKPGLTCQRFVDSWGQDDPEKYVQDFNRRAARLLRALVKSGHWWASASCPLYPQKQSSAQHFVDLSP